MRPFGFESSFTRRSLLRRSFRPQVWRLEERVTPDATAHNLAVSNFYQNWNDGTLITANDDWSGVSSVVGFLGDDTFGEGVDPQTILTPYTTINVIAEQGSNTALTDGGVAEFDSLVNPVVGLQGDGTAHAPNLVVVFNTTGRANISISYNLRDVDETTDDAVQSVALQYRIGNVGNFVNVPSGYVADATTGPSLATKVTPVSVTLPGAVDNQSLVQVRIITTNAVGNDEWVGVDDIVVGSTEFATNTFTTGNQFTNYGRAVAVDADGDAVVVWTSNGQDGSNDGIYGQRFNAKGAKVGGEFQINTFTTNQQTIASVAVDADGDAMVVWTSFGQDGDGRGIYGQRFNAAGAKVGDEFQINTHTTGLQEYPAVAMDAAGDAVVVWNGVDEQDGDSYGIFGQRFNAAGTKVGGEFQVNTYTTSLQRYPSVAVDADGDTVVVWESNFQDGSSVGVYGQRFNAAGAKVGGEFQINTYTTDQQRFSSVAVDADGDAVVVWQSRGQDGSGLFNSGIYGQRFNAAGAKLGSEFQINTFTTTAQTFPSVALDADGDALVVWQSSDQNGSYYDVYGQRFNSVGAKVGGEFQINTSTSDQGAPSVALDADGDAVVVWSSLDGSGGGVYVQRFRSPYPIPYVSKIQVNDGTVQRSMVRSLQIAFDSKVTFVDPAFTLVNKMTGNSVTLSAAIDGSGTVVTLTFVGGSIDLGGSLADGLHTLTIIGGQFTGNGFDGNGDGIPGDNYLLTGTAANGLYRLFGDGDGDAVVTSDDFALFRHTFGTGINLAFDFNNNSTVDSDDFAEFRKRFGISFLP